MDSLASPNLTALSYLGGLSIDLLISQQSTRCHTSPAAHAEAAGLVGMGNECCAFEKR